MTPRWPAALAAVAAAGCLDAPPGSLPIEADAAPPSLVAAYRFEALDMLADSSGNGHDGTCIGDACPISVSDRNEAGYAALFDGVDDLITAPPFAMGTFTVMFWMRLEAEADTDGMCPVNRPYGAIGADSYQFCLLWQTAGVARLYFYTTDEPSELFTSVALDIGVWHHVAIRWDGEVKTISYDGFDMATADGKTVFDESELRLGNDIDGNLVVSPFTGTLDDLEVWNGALSEEAIAAAAER